MWIKIVSFSFLLLLSNSLLNGAQASGAAAKPNPQKSIRQQLDDYAAQKPNAHNLAAEHTLFSEKWAQLKAIERDLHRKGSLILISGARKALNVKLRARLAQSEKERVAGQLRIQFLDSEFSKLQTERTKLIKGNVTSGIETAREITRAHNKIASLGELIAAKDAIIKLGEAKAEALAKANKKLNALLATQIKETSRLEEENAALKAAAKKDK